MTREFSLVLLGAAVTLAAPSATSAQQWGQGSTPRVGVCFYQDADYRGDYFCAAPGQDRSSLEGGMNDRISSIRIIGRAEVEVFEDRNYKGNSRRFSRSISNLKDEHLNDEISSFRVRESGAGSGSGGASAERIVRRAYQDILKREPDPEGMRAFRSRIIDDGWTEADVRDALRSSPEYRGADDDDAAQGAGDRPSRVSQRPGARARSRGGDVGRAGAERALDAAGRRARAPQERRIPKPEALIDSRYTPEDEPGFRVAVGCGESKRIRRGAHPEPAVAPRRCLVFSASCTRGSNGPVERTGSEARVQVY